jgi:hypothetical protein
MIMADTDPGSSRKRALSNRSGSPVHWFIQAYTRGPGTGICIPLLLSINLIAHRRSDAVVLVAVYYMALYNAQGHVPASLLYEHIISKLLLCNSFPLAHGYLKTMLHTSPTRFLCTSCTMSVAVNISTASIGPLL